MAFRATQLPEFLTGKKTTKSSVQKAGHFVLRSTPRAALAMTNYAVASLDGLFQSFAKPAIIKNHPHLATTTTLAGVGAVLGAVAPYVTAVDGGVTLATLASLGLAKKGINKAEHFLAHTVSKPERREWVDKAVLNKLAWIHNQGNKLLGADSGNYASRIELYSDYAVTRDRPQLMKKLETLATSESARDDFFGPHNNEARLAIQVFNVLSRSQNSDIRAKALEVLAARVHDAGSVTNNIPEAVARYHSTRTADDFTNILVNANSLNPRTIHHMFGDSQSALIFVHNAILHDQHFSSRLVTAKEGIHDGEKTVAELNEAQTRRLRSIAGREAGQVLKGSNSLEARLQRAFKGGDEIRDVKSNAAETNQIPRFNNLLLQPQITGDFRFSLVDFVRAVDSGNKTNKLKALEKLLAANSILEHRLAQALTQDGNHNKEIAALRSQQALMLRVLRDPKIIDDTGSLQRNIDKLWKSGEAVALINDHVNQVFEIHQVNQGRQAATGMINNWNNANPTDRILTNDNPLKDIYDKYQKLKQDYTALSQAYISSFNAQFGEASTPLVPSYLGLAQRLELISQRDHEATSPEALIARIHQDHSQLIQTLKTKTDEDKNNAIFRILASIRDSGAEIDQREAAYSLVVEALGSKHGRVTEAEINALTVGGNDFEKLRLAANKLFSVEKGYHIMEQVREANIRPYLLELYTQTQSQNPEIDGLNTKSPAIRDEIRRDNLRKYKAVQKAFEDVHGKDVATMTRIFEELVK